jgi:hypothetical protein
LKFGFEVSDLVSAKPFSCEAPPPHPRHAQTNTVQFSASLTLAISDNSLPISKMTLDDASPEHTANDLAHAPVQTGEQIVDSWEIVTADE